MNRVASFRSNDEFLRAVTNLIAKLESGGHSDAASELRDGLGCLNGLTDGWALLLESIEKVQAAHASRLARDERMSLETIRAAVHKTVYRR